MDISKSTLIDNILLADFQLYRIENRTLNFIHSELVDQKEMNQISPQMAFPLKIFKDNLFYFMVEPSVYVKHKENLPNIILSLIQSIKAFIEDTTLKKGFPQVGNEKLVDFKTVQLSEANDGYILEAQFKDEGFDFIFSFFIPRKTLNHFIALLVKKNIAKIDNRKLLLDFLHNLHTEFYKQNISFPFNVIDFFDTINNQDFQKIVGLMLSNNLMSYDMLWALSKKIEDGVDRVLANISKNQKDDFLEAIAKHEDTSDFRWIEIALYQIGLSLADLVKERKIESPHIERLKMVLEEIIYKKLDLFFYSDPFGQWIEMASENNILQDILSQCHDLTLAKGFISLQEKPFSLIQKNISKRKLQYLKEDMGYQKRHCSKREEIIAQYDIVKMMISFDFKNLSPEMKKLEKWIPRFKNVGDFNFAVNYVGPIEFSLSLIPLSTSTKRLVIKNLKPPLKYFISYFLTNKIKLTFPYGDVRIKEAEKEVVRSFYQLEQEKKITLKPIEEEKVEETILT